MGKNSTAVSKALPNKLPKKGFGHYFKRDIYLYLLLVLPVAYFIIFKYIPMYGIVIAFKEYNIFQGVLASPWIGWDAFREVFRSDDFFRALRNTFLLNGFDMIFGFPAPIILAIIINEVKSVRYKRISQTMLYLPHFLSWVIIGGIVLQIFAPNFGMIDTIVKDMGFKTIPFLTEKWHWLATYTGIGIWQSAGWSMIIYLAAISGIPAELYEAADVDGAGRLRKIWSITLPAIKSTIIILFILNIGKISMIGFDRPYILGNQQVKDFSDVISTYVYRVGLQSSRYNIATAVGLFQSIVGLVFLSVTNWIANKSGEQGIW
ncbi:ABC transporter permease [Ruminiclostridium cellulolyticum]|uniref:Binding-protein-dependent transport systems inner membrane component n=1 Tax=Ruminiclostridium cellulolyticum (strain ATCC 35319 / DSM 5812 / JCM 6584 / H10) TaxID=394503 RepID=B8I4H7_RUMCH|nr:ABC transporter permease subunit [Ruminiclostridium cellulolyticum]ACL74531.1 binding-protein-dependent transport systems inner membrane component [Ruminiclostridium cellulolyticum H10]